MNPKTQLPKNVLQKRISELSPEKRAIFEQLLNRSQGAETAIRPRDRQQDPPPLSFAQEQLWFLEQLAPGNWFYNETSALQLGFAVDLNALEWAVNEVVRRHEALRTTFVVVHGEPVQIITPELKLPIAVIDLRKLPKAERDAEARRVAAEDAQTPFDLAVSPLMRVTLLRFTDAESLLLLTMHHIVFDGWSFTILLRELSEFYEARTAGRAPNLTPLPIQYADYAVWQRKYLRGEVLESKLVYWRKQLADLPVLQLALDRPRPPVQRFQGARQQISISKQLCSEARALSLKEGLTLFMTLLTVFKALLGRYSGQEDLVVGVPMANRHRVEIEGLIGFFVNTLVMRTDISGDPTFREALGRVRKVALEAYEHQDLPFEKLVEDLHPQRDLSRNPLFQVTFQIYGSNTSADGESASIEDAPPSFDVESQTAKFDLRCDLSETAGGALSGFLEYDTELFDRETIARMAKHFEVLLRSAITDPDRRLSQLEMLTSDEKRQLLVDWNQTATEYPRERCIHQLFEAQAERTPGSVALVSDGISWTYAEVNAQANRLAHYLRRLGVGAESLVGISSERSAEIIVGLLAILKAGGAYLPLDLDDPRERLAFLTADAGVKVILTKDRQLFHLAERGIAVIPLSLEGDTLAAMPAHNPANCVQPQNLAYVMYTSGSTGKPKGVCVPHGAVVRLVCNMNYLQVTAEDVFLHFAPLAFDASTFEIWGALLNGARLVVFPPYVPSLEELGQAVKAGVTVLWLTSALFHRMVDGQLENLGGLRHLLAGGDVLSAAHVRKVLESLPELTLTNGYGPTENTTFTCTYSMRGPGSFGGAFPIGRPISNTSVYVLDPHGNPVPIGVPGELHAGGDGLARGYLNLKELTAQKFVPDPFSTQAGARLYRTGDLVRYRRDGVLEFLGRVDHQLKIRGFRVEPEEIEAVLRDHPAVVDAVCMPWEETPVDKRLVAYAATDGQQVSVNDLRRFLQERLPEYMVPASIIQLAELPMTQNGKVDRKALPAPDHRRPELDSGYVAPRTETERTITALWQEVLAVEKVGVNDNFFDLGGHSLYVVLLHNRMKETFQKDLSIVDLFRYPTVGSLAKLLSPEEAKPQAPLAARGQSAS